LVPPAAVQWPEASPGLLAWGSAAALAFLCTAYALVRYFELLARVGPTQAVSVTFLIPVFAMLWGVVFLGEAVTGRMLLGGAVVLLGIALALGLIGPKAPKSS
jgi:drug/metabolite transporter (DMT)-like permease